MTKRVLLLLVLVTAIHAQTVYGPCSSGALIIPEDVVCSSPVLTFPTYTQDFALLNPGNGDLTWILPTAIILGACALSSIVVGMFVWMRLRETMLEPSTTATSETSSVRQPVTYR